jgi:hypothetical protein
MIITQNYFQYRYNFYKPNKDRFTMGPISELVAEIPVSLRFNENLVVKNMLGSNNTVFYNKHVDDTLIISNGR